LCLPGNQIELEPKWEIPDSISPMSLPKRIYQSLVPIRWRASFRACVNLLRGHGLYQSYFKGIVAPDGQAIPWITYSAISYLMSLDLSNKRVFEFGCGASTKFWSRVAEKVVSVEGDKLWYERVLRGLPKNATLHLAADPTPECYIQPLVSGAEKYDIIFIDGWHRQHCARICREFLAEDGMIIHDNTDWYPETRKVLLSYDDLIPVDFFGFSPGFANTGVTSMYFRRSFGLKPAPMPPWIPGGLKENHEQVEEAALAEFEELRGKDLS
jgi:hypothetical protein